MKRFFTVCLFFITQFNVAFSQQFEWAQTSNTNTRELICDSAGNIFQCGWYNGTNDFDPGPGTYNLNALLDGAFYLQKLDTGGNLVWIKSFKGKYFQTELITDLNGNIIMAGNFMDTIYINSNTQMLISNGYNDAYITKLDANGNFLWAGSFGGASHDNIYSICTDAHNNIYCTGEFRDTVDFDIGSGTFYLNTLLQASTDVFLLKINELGTFQFVADYCPIAGGQNVIYHPNGFIYLSGYFGGTYYDFDPGPGTTNLFSNNGQGFICKIDTSGNFIKAMQIGSPPFRTIVDKDLSFIAVGSHVDSLDYDPGAGYYTLPGSQYSDAFILKLDSADNFKWAHGIGQNATVFGWDVVVDDEANIYLAGGCQGQFDADPGPAVSLLPSQNGPGFYILKLSDSGNLLRAFQFVSANANQNVISIDAANNLYTIGMYQGIMDADPSTNYYLLNSGIGWNSYLLKLSPDTCNNLALLIDSATDLTCVNSGYAIAHAINGTPPYQYTWNTTPTTFDSVATFTQGGIFTATVTDNKGCTHHTSLIIDSTHYQNQFDLEINMVSPPFVTGQNTTVTLVGTNNGCVPTNGYIILDIDSNTSFVSSNPPPLFSIGDSIYWAFYNLVYGVNDKVITVTLASDTSLNTNNDVCFYTEIYPQANDVDTTNNKKNYCFNAVTSYDPNDKKVYPIGECTDNFVLKNQPLTYTIRFQNTGDTTAFNAVILDSIDVALNINSLRVISASHTYITELLPGNFVKFRFDNINLPDSGTNQQASNGFIIYEITADSLTPDGTPVQNKAYILLDYNDGVLTNSVANTIVNSLQNADTSVTLNGITLTATATASNYQWINCATGNVISGATSQSYTAVANGNYAVIVEQGGCSDTSACYQVTTVSLSSVARQNDIYIYPNPASNNLQIDLPEIYKSTEISIADISGKTLLHETKTNSRKILIDLNPFSNGTYFIKIKTGDFTRTGKIVVLK